MLRDIYYSCEPEYFLGGINVTIRLVSPEGQKIWRISRRFVGRKDPEPVLRSLIQAHQN